MGNHVLVIAEAGVNHNGDINIAKELIDAAAEANADYVKFQTFKSEKVVSVHANTAKYQKHNLNSDIKRQLDMIRKYELNIDAHKGLIEYCKKKNILFLSTAFDLESIEMLNLFNPDIWKIPSGEITNILHLRRIGEYNKKTILSTGMSSLGDIERAIEILVKAGCSKENITALHCNTQYPTPYSDVNLKAMQTIRDAFQINVGYSDHTLGIEVPIAAVALGATVIEKHLTLDRSLEGPDHKASLIPNELKSMVASIRHIEQSLGNGIKTLSDSEAENINIARKSVVASRSIKRGERFTTENLTLKRPGSGISPLEWDSLIGKKAIRDFNEDELIVR